MENKYIYEALDVKDKKGSFAACEGLWQPATEDSVKAIVERVKACCETDEAVREKNPGYVGIARSAKDYEWENVKKRLDAGKVVDGKIVVNLKGRQVKLYGSNFVLVAVKTIEG